MLDKPCGMTSHDVVDVVRRQFRLRRVGHAGTLDPLASGLLLLMLGRATKIARYLTGMDKVYTTTVRFGARSTTGDAEGELTAGGDVSGVTERHVADSLVALTGRITQPVPAYAAVRARGKKRYELARAGQDVPEMTREVDVYAADLLEWSNPDAVVRFHCSSGTYVRSLAEAMGDAVGCGAYVAALQRDRIGEWDVAKAVTLEQMTAARANDSQAESSLIRPIEEFLPFPRLLLNEGMEHDVVQGRAIRVEHLLGTQGSFGIGDTIVLQSPEGAALAIGFARVASDDLDTVKSDAMVFQYERVLN